MDDFLDYKFGKNSEYRLVNKIRIPPHLFTVYLCYLDYDNKDKLFKTLDYLGLKHYLIKPRKEQIEYLKMLPAGIITKEMFMTEEKSLIDFSGVAFDKQGDIREIHKYLFDKITANLDMEPLVDMIKDFNNSFFLNIRGCRMFLQICVTNEYMKFL